jgi:hypothetical protein
MLNKTSLFWGIVKDPFTLSHEYLDNCARFPGSASVYVVRQHLGYFFQAEG